MRRRLVTILRRLRRAYGDPPPPRRLPPLDELVLTVLSQNTNDTNRDRAYADLRSKLPTWDDVAALPKRVREELEQFFVTAGQQTHDRVVVEGWRGPQAARTAIERAAEAGAA